MVTRCLGYLSAHFLLSVAEQSSFFESVRFFVAALMNKSEFRLNFGTVLIWCHIDGLMNDNKSLVQICLK